MNTYCYTPEPNLVNRFIAGFVERGFVHTAFHLTPFVACALTALGYEIEIDFMTYTQVMHDYAPDRNFDVIRIKTG